MQSSIITIEIKDFCFQDFKFRRALVNLWLCRSEDDSRTLRSRTQSINNNSNSLGQGPNINISHGLDNNNSSGLDSEGEKIEMTGQGLSTITRLTPERGPEPESEASVTTV